MDLKLEVIEKAYDQNVIFQNQVWAFSFGKVYALLGPSGKGKTTLLAMLAGQDGNFQGQLMFQNRWIKSRKMRQEYVDYAVAYYVQFPVFFEQLTGWQNIEISCHRQPPSIARFQLSRLPLEQTPSTLSGGQRKLLNLHHFPFASKAVLLFDEPTRGLDDKHVQQVMRHLCKQRHAIVIFATHDSQLAQQYADVLITL